MDPWSDRPTISIHAPIFYPILQAVAPICQGLTVWQIGGEEKNDKKQTALYIFVHAGEECPIILTNSYVLRNRPSTASSVMTTVPPSTPMPPHVPIRMNTGSLHFAWYINLIISCNRMPTDGTPMPWLIDSTGPTWIYCRRWTEWKEKWMSSVLYGLMKKISQVTLYIE